MKYLLIGLMLVPTFASAADLTVCIANNGSISARVKCKRGESKLTVNNLHALSLPGCFNSAVPVSVNATSSADFNCPGNTVLKNSASNTDSAGSWPAGSVFLFPNSDATQPVAGVRYYYDNVNSTGIITGQIEGTCCNQ